MKQIDVDDLEARFEGLQEEKRKMILDNQERVSKELMTSECSLQTSLMHVLKVAKRIQDSAQIKKFVFSNLKDSLSMVELDHWSKTLCDSEDPSSKDNISLTSSEVQEIKFKLSEGIELNVRSRRTSHDPSVEVQRSIQIQENFNSERRRPCVPLREDSGSIEVVKAYLASLEEKLDLLNEAIRRIKFNKDRNFNHHYKYCLKEWRDLDDPRSCTFEGWPKFHDLNYDKNPLKVLKKPKIYDWQIGDITEHADPNKRELP